MEDKVIDSEKEKESDKGKKGSGEDEKEGKTYSVIEIREGKSEKYE